MHQVVWYGTVCDCNVLVLPVLGRSLPSVLHAYSGRFSLPNALLLADQLVSLPVTCGIGSNVIK